MLDGNLVNLILERGDVVLTAGIGDPQEHLWLASDEVALLLHDDETGLAGIDERPTRHTGRVDVLRSPLGVDLALGMLESRADLVIAFTDVLED